MESSPQRAPKPSGYFTLNGVLSLRSFLPSPPRAATTYAMATAKARSMRGWHPMCAALPHAPHPTARARSDTLSSIDDIASRAQALELPGYGVGARLWKENGKTVRGVMINVEQLAIASAKQLHE